MNRRRVGRILIWFIPVLMLIWGTHQLLDLYASRNAHQNASRMLFEASNFQIELMSRFLSEAASAKVSSQLDALKNAVYSASYVHDRFARVFPSGQVDQLESLDGVLQFVLHLQIGGDRPLKEEEQALLKELDPLMAQLAEAYAGLMTENGKLNRFERGLIKDLDEQLLNVLKQDK